jgi:hypothetical protein
MINGDTVVLIKEKDKIVGTQAPPPAISATVRKKHLLFIKL